jgi:3-O-methylgallate 3,4-dioxygenase
MAQIVLGIGTSHTPMLAVPGNMWSMFAERDRANRELVYPPDGVSMSLEDAVESRYVPPEIRERQGDEATFAEQYERCQVAIETLRKTIAEAEPDITIIISDDQDEWFFDGNMPSLAVFWGEHLRLRPRDVAPDASPFLKMISDGYGDVALDVPVASAFGRHVIDHLMDHDFDIAHVAYTEDLYGGRVARRYPTPGGGELDVTRQTAPHPQGLGHGFSYVVKRLFDNRPGPILPVYQNTCYPPNHVRPSRSYQFGQGLAGAIATWDADVRIAVVASGGLSHFVVDEELDRMLLAALVAKDEAALRNLPRHRLYSATSESLNWVAAAGAMADTSLQAEIVDYVPVYRSEGGTGGGWAFARWM